MIWQKREWWTIYNISFSFANLGGALSALSIQTVQERGWTFHEDYHHKFDSDDDEDDDDDQDADDQDDDDDQDDSDD